MTGNRAAASNRGAVRLVHDPGLRFGLAFALLFSLAYWLLHGSGPVAPLNELVGRLTLVQAEAATRLLRLCGLTLARNGTQLLGGSFACDVGEGCNGMAAMALALAGILAFPAGPVDRLKGVLLLVPGVLVVNILRIAGLYWTGRHHPEFFQTAHVYVGQVLVILLTAALWWTWLEWTRDSAAASS